MLEASLSCFEHFHCKAGSCTDTCCAGWEIDLEDETVARYQTIPGALGEEIRQKLQQEDGYVFFAMERGQCPFLREDGLCRLILGLGESVLSETCREHPRFWEEYGDRRETCLSISCPEAARLLLEKPLELREWRTEELSATDSELDEELLNSLLCLRRELFSVAMGSLTLKEKLSVCLGAARAVMQQAWDGKRIKYMKAEHIPIVLTDYFDALGEIEVTRPRLTELLPAARDRWNRELLQGEWAGDAGSRLLYYFLYRYLLRSVWSGLVAEKICFAVYSTAAIIAMAKGMAAQPAAAEIQRAAVIFSREAEHNTDNLEQLFEAAYRQLERYT